MSDRTLGLLAIGKQYEIVSGPDEAALAAALKSEVTVTFTILVDGSLETIEAKELRHVPGRATDPRNASELFGLFARGADHWLYGWANYSPTSRRGTLNL